MLIECGNCGAPLDVSSDATIVDCTYCHRSNRVRETKTIAAITPPTWAPPTQWTPRKVEARTVAVAAGTAGAAAVIPGCAIVGAIVLIGVLGVGAATIALRSSGVDAPLAPAWDGTRPIECAGNDDVTIRNVTATLPNDTAITVRMNCVLTLENSTISAARGAALRGNGTLRLRNSTLRATETGAQLSLNAVLDLQSGQVLSDGVGIDARGNAEITGAGRVEGRPAIQSTRNVTVAPSIQTVDR